MKQDLKLRTRTFSDAFLAFLFSLTPNITLNLLYLKVDSNQPKTPFEIF